MRNIWTTCFILHNMTLRDQQTTQLKFEEQEDARNAVVEADVIPVATPAATSPPASPHPPTALESNNDYSDEDMILVANSTGVPMPTPEEIDHDATDDEVDYGEGIDRGFRAVRTRKEGRDFNGVMAAIKQMEDKTECILKRHKLIEHVWIFSGNSGV